MLAQVSAGGGGMERDGDGGGWENGEGWESIGMGVEVDGSGGGWEAAALQRRSGARGGAECPPQPAAPSEGSRARPELRCFPGGVGEGV